MKIHEFPTQHHAIALSVWLPIDCQSQLISVNIGSILFIFDKFNQSSICDISVIHLLSGCITIMNTLLLDYDCDCLQVDIVDWREIDKIVDVWRMVGNVRKIRFAQVKHVFFGLIFSPTLSIPMITFLKIYFLIF